MVDSGGAGVAVSKERAGGVSGVIDAGSGVGVVEAIIGLGVEVDADADTTMDRGATIAGAAGTKRQSLTSDHWGWVA